MLFRWGAGSEWAAILSPTLRSMISIGRSNSWTMHRGMAPPQGCRWTTAADREKTDRQAVSRRGVCVAITHDKPPHGSITLDAF